MEISVMLPAYQEGKNLSKILPQIHEALGNLQVEYEILVVDTMEPMDDTPEICRINNSTYVTRRGGNYYGDAIRTGFSEAKGTYLVVMDADGSHDPKDIARFYEVMQTGNYDLIIGSRYTPGGKTDNNFILRFMSHALNVAYRAVFHIKAKDVSDSYRMYKTTQLKELKLSCENFDIVEEILIRLTLEVENFRIKEVPIEFSKREFGESKRDLGKFIKSYLVTMKRLWTIRKEYTTRGGK